MESSLRSRHDDLIANHVRVRGAKARNSSAFLLFFAPRPIFSSLFFVFVLFHLGEVVRKSRVLCKDGRLVDVSVTLSEAMSGSVRRSLSQMRCLSIAILSKNSISLSHSLILFYISVSDLCSIRSRHFGGTSKRKEPPQFCSAHCLMYLCLSLSLCGPLTFLLSGFLNYATRP